MSEKNNYRYFSGVNQDIAMANTIYQVKEKVRVPFPLFLPLQPIPVRPADRPLDRTSALLWFQEIVTRTAQVKI
ncbi:MAG TPA: hypothetical protein VE131_15345 [Terriglobales bacterium]|nr:hypothetical protein [Terriglobales bacterium]